MPHWSNYSNFGTLEEADGTLSRTYTFTSNVAKTITTDPLLIGSNQFLIEPSSTCKANFNFTTSNSCTIKVSFSANYTGNQSHQSHLTWEGFSLFFNGNISLKIPLYKILDRNGREISLVNFNTMFAGENNIQNRYIYLKDLNRGTISTPSISISGTDFTLSHSCTAETINSDTGCGITLGFNSQGKTSQVYSTTISLAGTSINLTSNVIALSNKGANPFYQISTSNGEIITEANIGSFSNAKSSSNDFIIYMRDANRVSNAQVNYTFSDTSSPFTSVYSSCSASNLRSSTGCLMRYIFNPYNKTVGVYSANISSNSNIIFTINASVNSNSPYDKVSNPQFVNNGTGEILNSLEMGSFNPTTSNNVDLTTWSIKDLNSSTYPDNIGIVFSGLSSPFNIVYNQCANSTSNLNTPTGCSVKITSSLNQNPGTYSQTLNTNIGLSIPVNFHILGSTCTPQSAQGCAFANGQGHQFCNLSGTGYGTCVLNTCNSDYHEESGVCVSDYRTCPITNGQGIELWMGNQWSYQCNVTNCNTDFHVESNSCVSDTKSCTIENGIGIQSWFGNNWTQCQLTNCDNGYTLYQNQCYINTKPYAGAPSVGAENMILMFSGADRDPNSPVNLYEVKPESCQPNYLLINEECIPSNSVSTSIIFINGDSVCPINKYKHFYNSQTNKTICQIVDTKGLVAYKEGSNNYEDSSYPQCSNLEFEVSRTEIQNNKSRVKCEAKVCTPNFDYIKYTMTKTENGSVQIFNDTPPIYDSNNNILPFMGSCTRTCNNQGTGFGECNITSCNESNNFYFNKITKTCEYFNAKHNVSLDGNGNIAASAYINYSNKKIYVQLVDMKYHFQNIYQAQGTTLCSSINYDLIADPKGFKSVECLYDTNLSTEQAQLVFQRSFINLQTVIFPPDAYGNGGVYSNTYGPTGIVAWQGNNFTTINLSDGATIYYYPAVAQYPVFNTTNPTSSFWMYDWDTPNSPPPPIFKHTFSYSNDPSLTPIQDPNYRGGDYSYSCPSPMDLQVYYYPDYAHNNILRGYEQGCRNYLLNKCDASIGSSSSRLVPVDNNQASVLSCTVISYGINYETKYSIDSSFNAYCYGETHLENGICQNDVKDCSSANGDIIPLNSISSSKYWQSSTNSYSQCYVNNCSTDGFGFHKEFNQNNGALICTSNRQSCSVDNGPNSYQEWQGTGWSSCNLVCNAEYHSENGQCASNTQSCPIQYGSGEKTWNGYEYDSCIATSCISGYHTENNICLSNTKTCTINNGSGQQTWSGSNYGACYVSSCNANYHPNNLNIACDSNTISCTITNGIGERTWTGSSYGTCQLTECNNGYTNVGGSCINSQSCTVAHGSGTQSWSGTDWNQCQVSSCNSGYHNSNNSCDADSLICTNEILNAASAHKQWSGSSYGSCLVDTSNGCDTGYHSSVDRLSCDINTESCSIVHGTGTKTWDSQTNSFGTCIVDTCNNGYTESNNTCTSNLSVATTSSKTTFGGGDIDSITVTGGVSPFTYTVSGGLQSIISFDPSGTFTVSYTGPDSDKFGYLEIADSDGNIKTINLTIKSQIKICSPNTASYPGASAGTQQWAGSTYSDCNTITACNTPGYHTAVHNNSCWQQYKACDYQGPHASLPNSQDIKDENKTAEEIGVLNSNPYKINPSVRGLKKLDPATWTYSSCYAHKCASSYAVYPFDFTNTNGVCEPVNNRSCNETDMAAVSDPVVNGNYVNDFNDVSNTWGNCHLNYTNPSSICKAISGKTVEYRNFGTREFCAPCDNGKKAVFTRSTSGPITYAYTCETKQDKCNDNGLHTGSLMSDRITPTECYDEARGVNGKIDQYGNLITETTAYKFQSLPDTNAKCFDGSQAGFLYRKGKGSGATRWVIVLQGGGACGTVDSNPLNPDPVNQQYNVCQYAQVVLDNPASDVDFFTRLSNKYYFTNGQSFNDDDFNSNNVLKQQLRISPSADAPSGGSGKIGILSGDKEINPDFHNWNQVFIRYCSQDLWSGKGGTFTGNTSNEEYQFNGYYILSATFNYLKNQNVIDLPSLNDANNIIVSGYSAGGEGIFYHGNHIKNDMIGSNKDVAFLIDSGWVNDYSWGSNYNTYKTAFELNWNNDPLTNIEEGWESHQYPGSSPHDFVGSLSPTIDHAFVVQDIFDFEFMSYNAYLFDSLLLSQATNKGFSPEPSSQGIFKPVFVCNESNPSTITNPDFNKKASEWLYSTTGLMNYIAYDYTFSGGVPVNHKIFDRYSGVLHSKGRHGYTTSNDWGDSALTTTYSSQTKTTQQWFSQWYFNSEATVQASSFNTSDLNSINFTNFLNATCNPGASNASKNRYLYQNILMPMYQQ